VNNKKKIKIMSEETETNDGTMSGLKKTIIGGITTLITAGGVWVSTQLFGGHSDDEEKTKTEVAAPAAGPVVINLSNNNTNQQKQGGGGTTTIIKEKTVEKAAPAPAAKPKTEEEPW
jgi:flagellar basal body-associated protein FliL